MGLVAEAQAAIGQMPEAMAEERVDRAGIHRQRSAVGGGQVVEILPECEVIRIDQINEAFERMLRSDVRYRFVIDTSTL